MSDKEILKDCLETLKNVVVNYAYSLNEASSSFLYKEYLKQFEILSKLAKDLFNYAYEEGWYQLEEAPQKKIEQELTKLKQELEG